MAVGGGACSDGFRGLGGRDGIAAVGLRRVVGLLVRDGDGEGGGLIVACLVGCHCESVWVCLCV